MQNSITKMVVHDNQFVFFADKLGNLKYIDTVSHDNVVFDDCMPGEITGIEFYNNSVFVSDDQGHLKSMNSLSFVVLKDFEKVTSSGIICMIMLKNRLFIGDSGGNLLVINTKTNHIIKKSPNFMKHKISFIIVYENANKLFIASESYLKCLCGRTCEVKKDLEKATRYHITQMILYGKKLFLGDEKGFVHCIDCDSYETIQEFGQIMANGITKFFVYESFIYFCDNKGHIKLFNAETLF